MSVMPWLDAEGDLINFRVDPDANHPATLPLGGGLASWLIKLLPTLIQH